MIIGRSVIVKGELDGGEDVTIQGQVEGRITLKQHVLTIGTQARIRADLFAKSVVIQGEVTGSVDAVESVAISAAGAVDGDIRAPRVMIAEGARFRGSIDMQPGAAGPAEPAANRSRASASASPRVGSEGSR